MFKYLLLVLLCVPKLILCVEQNNFNYLSNINKSEIFYPVSPKIDLRITKLSLNETNANNKLVIVYLPSRSSFYEKNREFLQFLLQEIQGGHSVDVWCIDHRGHGKSGGRLDGDAMQRCHVDTFESYINDTHKVFSDLIIPAYNQERTKFFFVGSSMGGHIILRYLDSFKHDSGTKLIEKAVLIAPMIKFFTNPFPEFLARPMVQFATFLGFGRSYAFGYGDMDFSKVDFSKQKNHHNKEMFEKTIDMLKKNFNLVTSGPTFGYVKAAYDSQDKLHSIQELTVPVVVFLSGQDRVVDSGFAKSFCDKVGIKTFVYENAFHNLIKETEKFAPSFKKHILSIFH